MKLRNKNAEVFIPDGMKLEEALARTTHMAISAHQDDIEIMAYNGILECFGKEDQWFMGAVVTNGAGSPRDDLYASYTDEQMQMIRKIEQKKAAYVGEFSAVVLLDYPSSDVKDVKTSDVVEEIKMLLKAARPKVVYTHNLADKHDTHVSVTLRTIKAIRELPISDRPEKLYGCEVWRGLDWMMDNEKVAFDVAAHPNLAAAVLGVFDSQICGGKRYDLATTGRRLANATYAQSHGVDATSSLSYAMDLTPLIMDITLDIQEYVIGYIHRFNQDVSERLNKFI